MKKSKIDTPNCAFNKIGCTDYWVGTRKCDNCDWNTTKKDKPKKK